MWTAVGRGKNHTKTIHVHWFSMNFMIWVSIRSAGTLLDQSHVPLLTTCVLQARMQVSINSTSPHQEQGQAKLRQVSVRQAGFDCKGRHEARISMNISIESLLDLQKIPIKSYKILTESLQNLHGSLCNLFESL